LREVQQAAKRLCRESERGEPGVVPAPSSRLDPLNPPLSHSEYADLERDTSKYFLYYAAIRTCPRAPLLRVPARLAVLRRVRAFSCIRTPVTGAACYEIAARSRQMTDPDREVKIMVLGAGHGRLVTLCKEAAAEVWQAPGLPARAFSIEVLDANSEAVRFLRRCFRCESRVTVHSAVCINGANPVWRDKVALLRESCDLIVSEVLGSFGDNEFLPEIAAESAFFARPDALFIPCSFTTHCQLFSSR
jgi:hypothetical protein